MLNVDFRRRVYEELPENPASVPLTLVGVKWWYGKEELSLPLLAPVKSQQQLSSVLVTNTKPVNWTLELKVLYIFEIAS